MYLGGTDTRILIKQFGLKLKKNRCTNISQTAFQVDLLQKYGNSICLLDAACKVTKYVVPLFFVAVKTNLNYQVVVSFAIEDETTDAIAGGMSVFKSWNPQWQPPCFMIDDCDGEILAIRQNFQCKDDVPMLFYK